MSCGMPRVRWKLTKDATTSEPQVDEWGEGTPRFGYPMISLLALMAQDPNAGFEELAPGIYLGPKAP
jgi:hypothetical protein